MVNNCANPKCAKPLHYLRDGRIFVFDVIARDQAKGPDGKHPRRMEHYWLCGTCAQTMQLEQTSEYGIRLISKPRLSVRRELEVTVTTSALAS